jgi:hypothetical protein
MYAVKRYLTEWTLLDKPQAVQKVLGWLQQHQYLSAASHGCTSSPT